MSTTDAPLPPVSPEPITAASGPAAPARVLGPFSAMSVVIGAIIGVGIFFTPSKVASLTGDGGLALLAWAIAGLIALCGALVFAELGARYHDSGAQYQILRDAYGPCPAFLFVFCNATAIQGGAVGIIAFICASNLVAIGLPTGQKADATLVLLVSCALIGSVIAANAWGARAGAGIQNATVVAKVLALVVIAALAAIWGGQDVLAGATPPADPENIPFEHGHAGARLSPVAGVLAALVPAFFSYGGWQHALWISGEVREPRRNLPRAIIAGVVVVVLVYVLTAWSTMRLLGIDGVAGSTALAADAVGVVSPSLGRRLIAGAVAVSAFGVLNAQLLSGPRLVYAMARDGRFFRAFGRLTTRGTPGLAIGLIGGTGLVLLLVAGPGGVDRLLTGVVFIDGVFFALTGVALFVLRRRERGRKEEHQAASDSQSGGEAPGRPSGAGGVVAGAKTERSTRGFRVPLFPLVPALFVLGEVGVLIGSYLDPATLRAAIIGLGWIAVAAVMYVVWFRGGRGR
ncbi:MAG: amino acid permease [Phycisphaerales bacterium]